MTTTDDLVKKAKEFIEISWCPEHQNRMLIRTDINRFIKFNCPICRNDFLEKEIERLKEEHEAWIKRKDHMMIQSDERIADLEKEKSLYALERDEARSDLYDLEKENQELKLALNSLRKSSAVKTGERRSELDVESLDSQEGDRLYCSECGVMAEDCVCSLRESGEKK